MNVNELFLALAGFETDLEGDNYGEESQTTKELIFKVNSFSRSLRAIKKATSRKQDHPICDVIREKVEIQYLEELSHLESETISKIRSVDKILTSSRLLLLISDVIALTIDQWDSRINFTLNCLQKLTEPRPQQVTLVEQSKLLYSGDPRIRDLSEMFLEALDRCWTSDMCTELSQCGGRFNMLELVEHPKIREPGLVLETYSAMKQIHKSSKIDLNILKRMFQLIEDNQKLFNELEFPFRITQLNQTLNKIHANTNLVIRETLLRSEKVQLVLKVIREVVLFGSVEVVQYFNGSDINYYDIVSDYLERTGSKILEYDEDTKSINIVRDDLTKFVVNDHQWKIIYSVSVWLLQILITIPKLQLGSGSLSHAYRLLFQNIWVDNQRSIDAMFDELNRIIDSDKSMNISSALDTAITQLVHCLMLDKSSYRTNMRNALQNCLTDDPIPFISLVKVLEQDSDTKIDIVPFQKYTHWVENSMQHPQLMEALDQLKRNKGNATGQLRQIINSRDSKYTDIKPILELIEVEAVKPRVIAKHDHLFKYVSLLNAIVSRKCHVEHITSAHWYNFVQILLNAYEQLRDENKTIESIKHLSEIFNAVASLLESVQYSNRTTFAHIILICEDYLSLYVGKETSCHQHIMKIIRILTSLHITEAEILGNSIIEHIKKTRNFLYLQEIFIFSCMVPQNLNTLLEISPPFTIEPYEIEFSSSSYFDTFCFKPSPQADIFKFICMRALAISDQYFTMDSIAPKKRKLDEDIVKNFSIYAFQRNPQIEIDGILQWLNDMIDSDSISLQTNHNISWAFILIGQHIDKLPRPTQLKMWDITSSFIQDNHVSSSACFALSRCIEFLSSASTFDFDVLDRLRTLLILIQSSSAYPALSSGGIRLIQEIMNITILDDEFNKLRSASINQWKKHKTVSSKNQLFSSLFGKDCFKKTFFQQDMANILIFTVNYIKEKYEVNELRVGDSTDSYEGDISTSIHASICVGSLNVLMDYIWCVSVCAFSNSPQNIQLPEKKFEAFTESDIRGMHWFTVNACAYGWKSEYINTFLQLADWELAAQDDDRAHAALLTLKSKFPSLFGVALLGSEAGWNQLENVTSTSLRELQPLFQNYNFQRSTNFLNNVAILLQYPKFAGTYEESKLSGFLHSIATTQTEYSSLRVFLCQNPFLSSNKCIELLKYTDDWLCLSVVKHRKFLNDENISDSLLSEKLINTFEDENLRLYSCIWFIKLGSISVLDLFEVIKISVKKIMDPISSIMGMSHKDLISSVSLPLTLHSFKSPTSTEEIIDLLTRLGLSNSVLMVNNSILKSFQSLDIGRNPRELVCVVENVFKRCVMSTGIQQKATIIQQSFDYIQSCCAIIPQNVLYCWLENVCAFITVNLKTEETAFSYFDQNLKPLLNTVISGYSDGLFFFRVACTLTYAKLYECVEVILQHASTSSPVTAFKNLLKGDINLVLKTAWFVTETENISSKFEVWSTILHYAVNSLKTSNISVTEVIDILHTYPSELTNQIILWSKKVEKPQNKYWEALIGRLMALNGIQSNEFPKFQDFRDSINKVYSELPYARKWSLNPYFMRDSLLSDNVVPIEVLEPSLWDDEAACRGHHRKVSPQEDQEYYSYANLLLQTTLKKLNLPSMGSNIMHDVPEIGRCVIPDIIAFYEKENCTSSNHGDVVKRILNEALLSSSLNIKRLILDIAYRCFQIGHSENFILEDLVKISMFVLKRDHTAESAKYVGLMSTELIWNNNPKQTLTNETEDALCVFYSQLSREEYKEAFCRSLPIKNSINSITNELGVSDIWKKLNIGLERHEISNNSSDTLFQKNLEEAGLWKFANQSQKDRAKFFDFEKNWWLQEWDTLSASTLNDNIFNPSFKNTQFAPIISFFLDFNTVEDTFALFSRIDNLKMASCFSQIISDERKISSEYFDESSFSLICQGRELMFKSDPRRLALELERSCEELRERGSVNSFVKNAMKLENIASKYEKEFPHIRYMSLMQSAQAHWDLGNERLALSSLNFLLQLQSENLEVLQNKTLPSPEYTPDDSEANLSLLVTTEKNSGPIINPGTIYAKIGEWSRIARKESDSVILRNYFEKAETFAESGNAGFIYHTYAKFCDDSLYKSDLIEKIEDSRVACNRTEKQLDYIKQLFAESTEMEVAQGRYNQTKKLLNSQTQNLNDLLQHQSVLLTRCIQNYLLSVLNCDSYPSDVGRLVALWLENQGNEHVNTIMRLYLSDNNEMSSDNNFIIISKPVFKFLPWINQLTSHLDSTGIKSFQEVLGGIIFKSCLDHPYHSIWQLTNIIKTKLRSSQSTRMQSRQNSAKHLLKQIQKHKSKLLVSLMTFGNRIAELGLVKSSESELYFKDLGSKISKWWIETLPALNLPVPTTTIEPRMSCDYSNIPTIAFVGQDIKIAGGLSRPKIIKFVDTEGNPSFMLIKGSKKDDLRQDAIMEQVFHLTNDILNSSRKTRSLRIRTYNVVPYGATSGAIEFVQNTKSLKEVVEPLHQQYGGENEYSMRKARHLLSQKVNATKATRISLYKEIEEHTKPQMRHYWPQRFHDPHEWFKAKSSWSSSCAVMSIVGYILGLGDRHSSNLLVDTNTGEVVHIDLGVAFDQGKLLSIPELVPFRLTRDMVDGMGINGTNDVFAYAAEHTLEVMRQQKDRILTVLEVLKHDTLYSWRLPRVKLHNLQPENDMDSNENSSEVENSQAENALNGVSEKLNGSLSCEAEVRDLITQAVDPNNLALMFQGWTAFY